jgi:hypothetical protein
MRGGGRRSPLEASGEVPAGETLEAAPLEELNIGPGKIMVGDDPSVPVLATIVGQVVLARLNGSRLHPALTLKEYPDGRRDLVVFHPPSLGGGDGQCVSYVGRMPQLRSENQTRGWQLRIEDVPAVLVERAAS